MSLCYVDGREGAMTASDDDARRYQSPTHVRPPLDVEAQRPAVSDIHPESQTVSAGAWHFRCC